MLVADTSALLAVIYGEPEREPFQSALFHNRSVCSVATVIETHVVLARRQPARLRFLDRLLSDLGVDVVPVTVEQMALARRAFDRFGKGLGHPAQLNFGDCFAYALATSLDAPLLYEGGDFGRTDVRTAAV
jgi:ribonuclease VapC